MRLNRRSFLAVSAGLGAGSLLDSLGLDSGPTMAYADDLSDRLLRSRITTSICPYCAVGCGVLVLSQETADDEAGRGRVVVHVEGDPDHPINEGSLCSKGASLYQLANNEHRLTKVLYRPPGGARFEERDWPWAARQIARRIKDTRDETFTARNQAGQTVNRTTAIASVGSAALDNEECWLYQSMLRAMGLVYVEHQARI